MSHPRIDGWNRRRSTGTAVGDDQAELFAFQPASIQILEQSFPVRLTLSLAPQKRQQMGVPSRRTP
jgi:hypothetical protein